MGPDSSFGVLGVGAMGSALVRAWVRAGLVAPAALSLHDPDAPRATDLAAELGARAVDSPAALAGTDTLLLAVKPGDVARALAPVVAAATGPQLVISIAAGVTLARLAQIAPHWPLVRVMPNTPALVGAGAAAFARGAEASAADAAWVGRLFGAVGRAWEVKEHLLNAVTGLSGSGPAYVYVMIEALADGGVRCGLPRAMAQDLAAQTVLGGARMVLETGEHPGALKDKVASPAGTTIEGLVALEAAGLRSALIEAVSAATHRADEL